MPKSSHPDPGAVLADHFPRDLTDTALTHSDASLVLDITGHGRWTVAVDEGMAKVTTKAATDPTTTVHTDADTLADVLIGRRSGVDAFLDGDLTTRGSLATVLQIGGAFAPDVDLVTRPRSREVTACGVRTAYLEAGRADAPPVVLLHGLGATNASMLPVLADLAEDFRVLAPDLPGFGASEAPAWTYTAEQLHRWLRDFLGTVNAFGAVVIGNSLGGRLALELGMRDPDMVDKLVLLCPSPAFRRFRQLAPLARWWPVDIARLPMISPPRPVVMAGAKAMFARPDRVPQPWFEAAVDEFEIAMGHGARRRAALSALINIYLEEPFGDSGFWERLTTVRIPTLFLWGRRDRLVPSRFARHVSVAVPTAESIVLPDCGHVPQLELPEVTMGLTRRFLGSPRAATQYRAHA
ncbi:alpha/beta fold hydrolase [Rhodococcus koreensis]|uniref:alpha/beta fold hydrolase n=1 Tax=Rhodococcus koreensis TaxID=99653 RepID=UPI00197D7BD7|nr:alpha/beta fold hydrolase [Rhodococcus koreensis]QSE86893.1 alpha/beta fold hydrolase [Rhodococcus koreensis]